MAISRIKAELTGFDWHDLTDPETIGSWPLTIRVVVLVLMSLLCAALGYLLVGDLRAELASLARESTALHQELEQKSALTADLPAQRAITLSQGEQLNRLLRQLPKEQQVPELVDGITAVGHGSRLTFSGVRLDAERVRE